MSTSEDIRMELITLIGTLKLNLDELTERMDRLEGRLDQAGKQLAEDLGKLKELPKDLPNLPSFKDTVNMWNATNNVHLKDDLPVKALLCAHRLALKATSLGYSVPENPHDQYTFVFDWIDQEDPSKGKHAEIFQISTGFEYPRMVVASRQVMQWICNTLNKHLPYPLQ